jgi:pre-mRNA-splicing factor 18
MQQLRALGLPIRLFGEDGAGRLERLRHATEQQQHIMAGLSEMDEFRLGSGHGIRNPFLESKKEQQETLQQSVAHEDSGKRKVRKEEDNNEDSNDDDPHKRIYRFFKGLLRQWEDDLALRPETVKRSAAGRNETKTLKQCKDYIRPLFKLCKTRRLEESLMVHLIKIVQYCEEGEFVKANDSYLDVAIGRAAWPIGVTMVGIHARSGRAKIESSNVAHVMNSELQRKYLTSVKRLMSYCQKKREDVAPSKKVLC